MGDERACRSAAGNGLQRRGLDLGITCIIKYLAHGFDDLSAFQEGFLHASIDHQVNIALAVTQFGIFKGIIDNAILLLHHGQRLQRLAQQFEGLCMDADLARLGAEHVTLNAHKVTHVEQLLEHRVIQFLVLAGT